METSGFLCLRTRCVISQETVCLRACLSLRLSHVLSREQRVQASEDPQRAARRDCSIREGEEPSRCESASVSECNLHSSSQRRVDEAAFSHHRLSEVSVSSWFPLCSLLYTVQQRVNYGIGHVKRLWLCSAAEQSDRWQTHGSGWMEVWGLHYTSVKFNQHPFTH